MIIAQINHKCKLKNSTVFNISASKEPAEKGEETRVHAPVL
jgi:hypothetical protein